jgi:hypothetical protein
MDPRITVVLPVDDDERLARALAPGLGSLAGRPLGAVDNGLWRSTPVLLAHVEREVAAPFAARQPFDHLAPDFDDHQRALGPLAKRIAGAITALGN